LRNSVIQHLLSNTCKANKPLPTLSIPCYHARSITENQDVAVPPHEGCNNPIPVGIVMKKTLLRAQHCVTTLPPVKDRVRAGVSIDLLLKAAFIKCKTDSQTQNRMEIYIFRHLAACACFGFRKKEIIVQWCTYRSDYSNTQNSIDGAIRWFVLLWYINYVIFASHLFVVHVTRTGR